MSTSTTSEALLLRIAVALEQLVKLSKPARRDPLKHPLPAAVYAVAPPFAVGEQNNNFTESQPAHVDKRGVAG